MITVVKSLTDPNRFFIFRDYGIEVGFSIVNNQVKPTKPLFIKEMNFIKENILKTITKSSCINQKTL